MELYLHSPKVFVAWCLNKWRIPSWHGTLRSFYRYSELMFSSFSPSNSMDTCLPQHMYPSFMSVSFPFVHSLSNISNNTHHIQIRSRPTMLPTSHHFSGYWLLLRIKLSLRMYPLALVSVDLLFSVSFC
jgi:hypothetical protein